MIPPFDIIKVAEAIKRDIMADPDVYTHDDGNRLVIDGPVNVDSVARAAMEATVGMTERQRCVAIIRSIEVIDNREALLIETLVRRFRGDE